MQNTNKSSAGKTILTVVFTALFLICAATSTIIELTGYPPDLPGVALLSGLMGKFISVVALTLIFAVSEKFAIALALLPVLSSIVCGFVQWEFFPAASAILFCVSPCLAAAAIYFVYKRGEKKSVACALGAAFMTLFDLAAPALSVLSLAISKNARFSTVLFSELDKLISTFVKASIYVMENASGVYPGNTAALPSEEILYSSGALVVALIPAIIYCTFFMLVYFASGILDILNKKAGLVPERTFGKYTISHVTFSIFTIISTIIVFMLFFSNGMSNGMMGLLCALFSMLPHFIILGYRRLYRFLGGLAGNVGAFIITAVASAVALLFVPQIFICIIAFLGTSEYRASILPPVK